MDKYKRLMKLQTKLAAERQAFETIWQEAYEFISPENATITKEFSTELLRSGTLYATSARRVLPFFVGIMQSAIMPANQRWHKLVAPTEELRQDTAIGAFYQSLTNMLFEARYKPEANFNGAMVRNWKSDAAVGHGITYVEDFIGHGLYYKNIQVQDFLFRRDNKENLTEAFWRYKMSGADIYAEVGEDKAKSVLPPKVIDTFNRDIDSEIEVTLCAYKISNEESAANVKIRITEDGKATKSYPRFAVELIYFEGNDAHVLKSSHSRSFPFIVAPYDQLNGSPFSVSPTIACLADLKMKNRIRKSNITGAERAADPAILSMQDATLSINKPRPGALVGGGMVRDANGKPAPAMQALDLSGNMNIAFEMENLIENEIGEYFLKPLFFLFYGTNQPKTATEINQLAMERSKMMSVLSCPVERHLIYPMIERELDILWRQGKFPKDIPEKVRNLFENGEPTFAVEYEGEVKRAQLLQQAAGIMQTVEVLGSVAQFDPNVKHTVKWAEAIKSLATTNDMPLDLIRTEEEYEKAVQEEQAEMMRAEQMRALNKTADQARQSAGMYLSQSMGQ